MKSPLQILLFAIFLASVSANAQDGIPGVEHVAVSKDGLSPILTESMGCSTFRWIKVDGLPEKAALLVPIVLEGKEYWFQLDTGSDATIINGSHAKERGWKTLFGNTVRVPNGVLTGLRLSSLQVASRPELEASDRVQGTLGLDLLIGYMVVLDFPGQHFCVIPRADFPPSLSNAAWSPAEVRGGKLHIDVSLNGEQLDLFYDTGSSWQGVDVDFSLWKKLTGRSGEEDAKLKLEGPSWGRTVKVIGSASLGELRLGRLRIPNPLVTTLPATPNEYRDDYHCQGVLGNAPFFNDIVVLDLGIHPAFGVITLR